MQVEKKNKQKNRKKKKKKKKTEQNKNQQDFLIQLRKWADIKTSKPASGSYGIKQHQ